MSYESQIEKYKGTHHAQELKFTERMIRKMQWVSPNEPIPDSFFWDQFVKNQKALATMFFLHERNLDSWRDAKYISQSKIAYWVANSLLQLKQEPEQPETPEQETEHMRILVMIRTQLGDLPMFHSPKAYTGIFVYLFLWVCAIALCFAVPVLGVILIILLGWVLYTMSPKK